MNVAALVMLQTTIEVFVVVTTAGVANDKGGLRAVVEKSGHPLQFGIF
jgi:hypothetical protein